MAGFCNLPVFASHVRWGGTGVGFVLSFCLGWDWKGSDRMEWDGMGDGRNGMEWDGMGRAGVGRA